MAYIETEKLKAEILESTFMPNWCMALLNTVIDHQPTVDAVEVVRCKDCRYFNPVGVYDGS